MEANGTGQSRKRKPAQPPRPRRAVEAEYLAALADAVPLSRWRRIVEATADQAEKGDAKARECLAHYLLGEKPPSLVAIAAEAAEGIAIGDRALMAGLIRGRKDAHNQRAFEYLDAEAAGKTLARLERPPEELGSEKQVGEQVMRVVGDLMVTPRDQVCQGQQGSHGGGKAAAAVQFCAR